MEQKIIDTAIYNLTDETGLKMKFTPFKEKLWHMAPDGLLEINIGNNKVHFNAIIKNELRNYQLQTIQNLRWEFEPIIIIADRLFPKIKTALRELKIAYLESNGNCYIENENHLLFIKGRKTQKVKEEINRAFTKAGLKLVFQFLSDPKTVNAPYRQLAADSGVATGNITYVKNGLTELGFLIKINNQQERIRNIKELFNHFVDKYDKILKPTLHVQNYRFLDEQDFNKWEQIEIGTDKTKWGGEAAGKLYTKYLKPQILTLYTNEDTKDLIKRLRLVPDSKGNVKVYKTFWNNNLTVQPVTNPILTYADLVSTGNARCIETADRIYNTLIDEHLQRFS